MSNSTLISFVTSDNITYLLDYAFFSQHSKFVKDLQLSTVKFNNIHSSAFKFIVKYLENRKISPETIEFPKPLPVGQLKSIIHELDFDLVEEIEEEGGERFREVISACSYLQIEYFKKILLVGVAYKYLNKNPQEIREYYGLEKLGVNQEGEYKERLAAVLSHIKPQQEGEEEEEEEQCEQEQQEEEV